MAKATFLELLISRLNSLPNSVGGDGRNYAQSVKGWLFQLVSEVSHRLEELERVPGNVAELVLTEQNALDNNNMPQSNLLVSFQTSHLKNFACANVWVSVDGADYQMAGSTEGNNYLIENVKTGATYSVKVTSVNSNSQKESSLEYATVGNIIINGWKLIPDPPRQFFFSPDSEGVLWNWIPAENTYVDFFELRLDNLPGVENENLLERTKNSYSRVSPKSRTGTAYLFAHNIFGEYSIPAQDNFSKPTTNQPTAPAVLNIVGGVQIYMEDMPSEWQQYHIVINDTEQIYTVNNNFVYFSDADSLTIKYSFVDAIGESEYSQTVTVNVTNPQNAVNADIYQQLAQIQADIDALKNPNTVA